MARASVHAPTGSRGSTSSGTRRAARYSRQATARGCCDSRFCLSTPVTTVSGGIGASASADVVASGIPARSARIARASRTTAP